MSKKHEKSPKKRKKSSFILFFMLIVLICGGIGGFFGCAYLTRNDKFELVGSQVITLKLGEQYQEEGAIAIAWGRKLGSDKIIIESNLDEDKIGEYQISYSVDNFRFTGVTLYRKVNVVANDSGEEGDPDDGEQDPGDVITSGELSIHFLELGTKNTGDSIFIKYGDVDILIDAGSTNASSTTIINYLDQYVTDNTLEYVIATHGHTDHISAFYSTNEREGVFEHYQTEVIIDFPMTNSTGGERTVVGRYKASRDLEVENGAKHYTALECYNNENGAKRIYEIGEGVELEILYNYYYENSSSSENDFSVCVMINQGENHYLFTGDLEKRGEEKLVDFYQQNHGGLPHCVLYKAGHHGSGTSSCPKLLEAITPEYICICTCAGTSEYTDNKLNQFPYQSFIDNIAPYTDKVYVTSVVDVYVDKSDFSSNGTVKSMNGNIIFSLKDGQIMVECSNNNLLLKETDWFKENRTMPSAWVA